MTATTRPRAVGLLCLVIALWGANWPIMKVGLLDMPPLTFAAVRLLLATLTLFVISPRRLKLPAARDLPVVLSVGLLQLFAFMLCMYLALMVVPAGRSAILAYTTPIWVVPMATLWLGERMTPLKALALAIGLAGIGVLFNPAALDWGSRAVLIGNGLLLAARQPGRSRSFMYAAGAGRQRPISCCRGRCFWPRSRVVGWPSPSKAMSPPTGHRG